jgi:alkylhydroperoxidase family enzyme
VSWVTDGRPASFDDLVALHPTAGPELEAMRERLWTAPDLPPRVLELVRQRVAKLLGCDADPAERTADAGVDDVDLDALDSWHDDPRFDVTDRACLDVAEQFVIDPHGVTDAQVDAVRARLGDRGAVALFIGLAVFEGLTRARMTLDAAGAAREPVPGRRKEPS